MTSERKPLQPIPAEDGAIEEAFAALDTRITAFASSFAHAVAELGVADQAVEQPETPAVVEEPQPSLADMAADSASETGLADRVEPVDEARTESLSVEPEPEASVHEESPGPVLPEPDDEAARDALGRMIPPKPQAAEAEEAPADTQPSEEESEKEEDEALLASLDEETAKAIRIMRRLSPVKKRVSELLEEYRATQAAQQSAPQQKKQSWWTRG